MLSKPAIFASTLALLAGLAGGWFLCRHTPGRLLRVSGIPSYEPVVVVPDSVGWPAGPAVAVQTIHPPTRKAQRDIEDSFSVDLSRTNLLGKFDLPAMPDGGKAVITVPKGGNEREPLPVSLIVGADPPPLFRARWRPEMEAWYGFASGGDSASRALYIGLPRLICIRDRVCGQARGGYEDRPWGEGWLAEVGVSVRF